MNNNPPASECGNCQSSDRLILHNVRIKGVHSKLCTTCVLRLHHTFFCPHCFNLHENPISNAAARTLTCLRCSAVAHAHCITDPAYPKTPYLCPPCNSTTFKFFDFKKPAKIGAAAAGGGGAAGSGGAAGGGGIGGGGAGGGGGSGGGGGGGGGGVGRQVIREEAAKALLAASRISANSINKWAASVKVEADRKVKEAALAKKRAKEAIEHVFALSAKYGSVKRREVGVGAGAVRNGGGSGNSNKNEVGEEKVNGSGTVVVVATPISVVRPQSNGKESGGTGSVSQQGK